MKDTATLKAFLARRDALQRRAKRIDDRSVGFLHRIAATTIGERLAATNREFEKPALMFHGPFAGTVLEAMEESPIPVRGPWQHVPWPVLNTSINGELMDIEPDSLDLIVSVFDLQQVFDLPNALFQIHAALKPDGLFIGCILAAGTLSELQRALLEAEASETQGAAQRIDRFAETRAFGDLLQRTGFKLVVTDIEEERVGYGSLFRLAADLRAAGATSFASADVPALRKGVIERAEALLRSNSENARFSVTARIAHFSGWKHAETQQKPLKPGTAKVSLKDVL